LKEIYGEKVSFLASLLWAIHPIHTEAITYISGTADPLFLFFGLLGIYLYSKNYKILSYISFIFSLFSKETAVLILPLFFLYLYCCNKFKKGEIKHYIIITGIFIIYFVLRKTILNFGTTIPEDIFIHRFFTAFKGFLVYISILLFPFILSMERHIPYIQTYRNMEFLTGFILFLLILYFLWIKKEDKKILFAGILFIGNWFFHSNIIIPLNGNLREHWMYMGSIGFFIYFVMCVNKIKQEKVKKVLIIFIFLLYGLRTVIRNYDWKEPENFYLKSIKYFPQAPKLWTNLGHIYLKNGKYDMAIKCFEKTLSLKPDLQETLVGLAMAYYLTGDVEKAKIYSEKALNINQQDATAHFILGLIYKKKGDHKKGIEYLLTSIKIYPGLSKSYYFLGKWFLEYGDYENAEIFFKRGLEEDPSESLNFNALGILNLIYKKNYSYALYLFQKAHHLKPDESMYIFNIGKTYQILNNHKEAILWYEKGLSLEPDNLQVLNDLAISYAMIGEKEKAINILKDILQKDRNFKPAIDNLKIFENKK